MKYIHLLLSNLIGQNLQAMVQTILDTRKIVHFSLPPAKYNAVCVYTMI